MTLKNGRPNVTQFVELKTFDYSPLPSDFYKDTISMSIKTTYREGCSLHVMQCHTREPAALTLTG